MGTIKTPYLITRTNKSDGSTRYYFCPRQSDRDQGWATVRLHDAQGRPIRDPLRAAEACEALVAIYTAWRSKKPGFGPLMIDALGRVVSAQPVAVVTDDRPAPKIYRAGEIGAMVADFLAHDIFKELGESTQYEYRTYLNLFVLEFGSTRWRELAPGKVRKWLQDRAAAGGPSGAHALYRTARALFGKIRLCYDSVDHPGFVPANANPLEGLDLGLPHSPMIIWPRGAVQAFVELADEQGQQSIGDALVMMSWLGVRRQDWLEWPADVFDKPLIAFAQEKTDAPNVLPWDLVPELVARVSAAKERRKAAGVTAWTFFHNADGLPWIDAEQFRRAFNKLRDKLQEEYGAFETRYFVGLIKDEPLRVPTNKLTMRTMRHTCVTFNADAGVPPHLIGSITGHSQKEIDDILAHYQARTADQAAAAITMRLEHEKRAKG